MKNDRDMDNNAEMVFRYTQVLFHKKSNSTYFSHIERSCSWMVNLDFIFCKNNIIFLSLCKERKHFQSVSGDGRLITFLLNSWVL